MHDYQTQQRLGVYLKGEGGAGPVISTATANGFMTNSNQNNPRTLHLVFTSDTHGNLFPVSYGTGKKKEGGVLCLAERLQHLKENPDFPGETKENTLILDGGDSLQGTPLTTYYLSHEGDYPYHPVAEAFNACGLSYFTLGNHDFNFGYENIKAYLNALHAQCICANVRDKKGELPIVPYVIHTMENGLRVGITAAVTDWVNVWELSENLRYLDVTEPEKALKEVLSPMQKEGCDLTIAIYHGGFEEDLQTGEKLTLISTFSSPATSTWRSLLLNWQAPMPASQRTNAPPTAPCGQRSSRTGQRRSPQRSSLSAKRRTWKQERRSILWRPPRRNGSMRRSGH